MDYELIKDLYGITTLTGYSDEEIAELTEGFDEVPAALQDFWKTCGNTRELFTGSNDPWMNLDYCRRYTWMRSCRDYFFLLNENQGVYQAAIRRSDMGQADPPVYVTEPTSDGAYKEVGQAAPSVTEFLMGMLLYEAALSAFRYSSEDIEWYEPEELAWIEEHFTKYPYHVDNWYCERIDLYTLTGDELLFIMQGDAPSGMYSARTQEAYDRIEKLMRTMRMKYWDQLAECLESEDFEKTEWYRPNNVAICMAGDFDPDKTIAIIDKYFSSWKPGADVKQPTFASLPPLNQPKDTTIVGQEAEQIWMGWRANQANALQADTLDLMEDVLSNGRAGLFDLDLNQTMKVQRALGGTELLHDHGAFFLLGTPKQGQSLDEVKTLMLAEIDKLKKGDFPDNLLPSIINNKKRSHYQLLESNEGRADMFVDAFINEVDWKQEVGKIDRISKITKKELVDFANKFFTDGYVVVYKKQGIDSTQKKIDKPAITPIPANRDMMSQFVKDIQNAEVEPIQPKFVDFQKDFTVANAKKNLPLYYIKNNTNGLFNLIFHYDFGQSADNRYDIAADYIKYLGTDKLQAAELKQKFYELACDWNINVGPEETSVTLSGLSENMPAALALLEDLLQNAQADKKAYDEMVSLTLKKRQDAKKSQGSYFGYLYYYGSVGKRNRYTDVMSEQQLKDTDPQVLVDLLKGLSHYQHRVAYYGPMEEKEVAGLISKAHVSAKQLAAVPQNHPYLHLPATENEVLIAPYDAKNIYMRMYHNEGRTWNPEEAAVQEVFNEYFGGGMNGIVFQEMREARGLAYNAYAYYYSPTWKDRKECFITHIITQNDKMADCITHFNEILNEMPASETAFQIAKDAVAKRLASARTTKMGIFNSYLSAQRLGLGYSENELIYKHLDKVTLNDIVNFEKANMANKPLRYIILGDENQLDMKALEKIGPVKRLTTEEVFGY